VIVVVEGVLEREGARLCEKMYPSIWSTACDPRFLPGVAISVLRRLGLSFERPAKADVVLPATND
jgi:hypothetical protein